ncbi:helix-turn-helix domain-containing protein [Buttiauxella noackiae]|uniref:helix-turn-helix domain-containing protein n=1 Tax=Buttiauxella noackiae TaxID=82992 RepID=UPI0028D548EB|nr:helix-turn-helix domain-containing protein [Buttiauxella noackiae]
MTIYHELPAGYVRRLKGGESIAILNRDYGLNHVTSHRLRKKLGLMAFEHLSPEQRYAKIWPLHNQGLPHRSIAKSLGWSPTTVLNTIHLFEGKQ